MFRMCVIYIKHKAVLKPSGTISLHINHTFQLTNESPLSTKEKKLSCTKIQYNGCRLLSTELTHQSLFTGLKEEVLHMLKKKKKKVVWLQRELQEV